MDGAISSRLRGCQSLVVRNSMSAATPSRGGFADDGGVGVADDLDEDRRVDLAGAEVLVTVAARVGVVLRVVGVHQVDAPGDGGDALRRAGHLLARRVGVTRVEAEPDAERP